MMREPGVYIIESLGAMDFYKGRLDGHAAHEVLKIEKSHVQYRIAIDLMRLKKAIAEAAGDSRFNILHLSCHGDFDGVELTSRKQIDWPGLASILQMFAGPEKILVMSSCKGGNAGLTKALEKKGIIFGWVFGATEDVGYTDSCLA
ncbi:MAG: hypothetical protein WA777_00745 [Rhodanobacter sp.]